MNKKYNYYMKHKDDNNNKIINENTKIMLKDQKGSKYMQKKIEEKSPEFLNKLYEQIKNNLFEIMTDQYGNYVIQKFVENCDKKLISKILKNLSNNTNNKTLYEISINNYGTRPLQKMIENLSSFMTTQDINIILNMCKGNVHDLIKDINGNRVVQSIIQNIKNKELLSPLYKEMNENIIDILKTKSGCCVFSKVLLNITELDLNSLYLIDFGLSCPYLDLVTRKIFGNIKGFHFVGTLRYSSINSHRGIRLCRKDDLESMLYVLIYFYKGKLPWQDIKAKDDKEKTLKIKEKN